MPGPTQGTQNNSSGSTTLGNVVDGVDRKSMSPAEKELMDFYDKLASEAKKEELRQIKIQQAKDEEGRDQLIFVAAGGTAIAGQTATMVRDVTGNWVFLVEDYPVLKELIIVASSAPDVIFKAINKGMDIARGQSDEAKASKASDLASNTTSGSKQSSRGDRDNLISGYSDDDHSTARGGDDGDESGLSGPRRRELPVKHLKDAGPSAGEVVEQVAGTTLPPHKSAERSKLPRTAESNKTRGGASPAA